MAVFWAVVLQLPIVGALSGNHHLGTATSSSGIGPVFFEGEGALDVPDVEMAPLAERMQGRPIGSFLAEEPGTPVKRLAPVQEHRSLLIIPASELHAPAQLPVQKLEEVAGFAQHYLSLATDSAWSAAETVRSSLRWVSSSKADRADAEAAAAEAAADPTKVTSSEGLPGVGAMHFFDSSMIAGPATQASLAKSTLNRHKSKAASLPAAMVATGSAVVQMGVSRPASLVPRSPSEPKAPTPEQLLMEEEAGELEQQREADRAMNRARSTPGQGL